MDHKILNGIMIMIACSALMLGLTLGRVFMRYEIAKSCNVIGAFSNGSDGFTCKPLEK